MNALLSVGTRAMNEELLSPSALAATVAKSGALQRAEETLRVAIEARDAKRAEMLGLQDPERNAKQIHALDAELIPLEQRAREAKANVRPLRVVHGAAVAAALKPARQADGRRLLELIAELKAICARLDEGAISIERHGGNAPRAMLPELGPIEVMARRVAG